MTEKIESVGDSEIQGAKGRKWKGQMGKEG
jgi:hypothetical protein